MAIVTYNSEAELQAALTAGDVTADKIVCRGGKYTVIEAGFSAEALAAFAKYDSLGDGLTGAEKTAMAAYIDAEVTAGNHAKKDYETIYSLSGNNALVDYIGGKVATAVNAPTQSINGFTFDGATQYMNSNYNPSTDGINFQLTDAQVAIFVYTNTVNTNSRFLFGAENNFNSRSFGTYKASFYNYRANDVAARPTLIDNSDKVLDYVLRSGADKKYFRNGSQNDSFSQAADGVPQYSFFIADRNRAGSGSGNPFDGTITTFMAGAVLADQSAYNTNLRTLLTALGVSL
jgi:hypothetical protein